MECPVWPESPTLLTAQPVLLALALWRGPVEVNGEAKVWKLLLTSPADFAASEISGGSASYTIHPSSRALSLAAFQARP